MHRAPLPFTHDVVLIGGGHTHALVLRRWGMRPLPGARLTLINPGPTAAYSGMLPGHVAGHYDRDILEIDLIRLARFADARLILGAADHIDLAQRVVLIKGHPPVSFDRCSVDVGITSDMPDLPGFADHGVPAKPLGPFAASWSAFVAQGGGDAVVIGAGVAGAELAVAMAYRLQSEQQHGKVSLIDNATALSEATAGARHQMLSQMRKLNIDLIENAAIAQVASDHIELADGRRIPSRFTTGTASAFAFPWIAQSGLDLHEGFICVDDRLRSSDPAVFAVGDCAHMRATPRPKAGVYAVRQAPVLYHNIVASLTDRRLRRYRPQADYLKLMSMGRKAAVAQRFGLTLSGPLMWRWKDRIDRKFIEKFRNLPQMPASELPALHTIGLRETLGDQPLCGGCGAKVGRAALRDALAPHAGTLREDITPLPGDDAALLHVGGARMVLTSDHLRAFSNDPVVMTRIAAIHALGDIWAMGGTPQAATATIILPRLSPDLQRRTLSEITATAHQTLRAAGAEIVGGHTTMGDELTIGFTITGLCDRDPITLAGAQAGDALILTKPLGTGVLMAAEMAGQSKGRWIAAALAHMTRPQADAAQVLADAHAMTDVTGFGLAGHLLGICEASGLAAHLQLDAIPLLAGAPELAGAGIRSTLFPQNRALTPDLPEGGRADLLFDPQTAGGLLAAVAPNQADILVAALRDLGHDAARVGFLTDGPPRITLDPD
ncbi:selenide, water dikinase SelD [Pontibaca salina]|uniref:Selenide, water dikinase SelD n=1 Tax=Pontibaca salina TaxID=2795731 RepID=A0A934HNJ4_9RHOB|nr:selenide, water dikinase SelD [Pontibaca salina]MBI6628657.1 selenide, water dikinase SelD [Pontibaca salina]